MSYRRQQRNKQATTRNIMPTYYKSEKGKKVCVYVCVCGDGGWEWRAAVVSSYKPFNLKTHSVM